MENKKYTYGVNYEFESSLGNKINDYTLINAHTVFDAYRKFREKHIEQYKQKSRITNITRIEECED